VADDSAWLTSKWAMSRTSCHTLVNEPSSWVNIMQMHYICTYVEHIHIHICMTWLCIQMHYICTYVTMTLRYTRIYTWLIHMCDCYVWVMICVAATGGRLFCVTWKLFYIYICVYTCISICVYIAYVHVEMHFYTYIYRMHFYMYINAFLYVYKCILDVHMQYMHV